MKLADLKDHQEKHKAADEVPAIELEDPKFTEHVTELYKEVKPRPDQTAKAEQWDREIAALTAAGEVRIAGVRIRRI